MKIRLRYLLLGIIPLLASCASQPITLAPVGPRPVAWEPLAPSSGNGQLQVFTATEEYDWNRDVPFFPHSDYQLYTADGQRLKRVWNHQTHEDETPAVVTLPAGNYVVKADAELYGVVSVPVVIKPNQTTRIILQPGWKPGATVASSDLVQIPGGYPVGWRADLPPQK
jgi:hypothetical protein